MRSLSPTLLAAQQGPARRPYLEVVVQDQVAGMPRRRLERLYTGNEADGPHALTVPGDGSLVRAWNRYTDSPLWGMWPSSPPPRPSSSSGGGWGAPGAPGAPLLP